MHGIHTSSESRCREFGAFLRSRRERLTPNDVGLPPGFRRRTPGLRREEVSLLAGVGTTWYTWLEQGRDVRASSEVLTALANALRLDAAERHHLFVLGGHRPPEAGTPDESVAEPLRRMLSSLTEQPAFVLGRRMDYLDWNEAATAVFGDLAELNGDERNALHLIFANEQHRRLLLDWEEVAHNVLATFRADSAHYPGDHDFERLVEKLKHESPEFRELWSRHDVLRRMVNRKRIQHPTAGHMVFEYTQFAMLDHSGMKFVVYTPLAEERTPHKLKTLLQDAVPMKQGL